MNDSHVVDADVDGHDVCCLHMAVVSYETHDVAGSPAPGQIGRSLVEAWALGVTTITAQHTSAWIRIFFFSRGVTGVPGDESAEVFTYS